MPTRRAILRLLPALVTGGLMLVGASGAASPASIDKDAMILLSRESESFRKAGAAACARLERSRLRVTTSVVDEEAPKAWASTIITLGTEAAQWARDHAPAQTTIVACLVADYESAGLTTGRIVHGVLAEVPAQDQLTLIRDALPEARRIGVPFNPGSSRGRAMLEALRAAAGEQWTIEAAEVTKGEAFAEAIDTLIRKRVDIIWTMPDSSVYNQSTIRSLLQSTLRARVPVYGFSVPLVKAGALLGAGVDPTTQGEQAAELALDLSDQIDQPQRLQNARYETAINLAVAKQMGVRIAPATTARATHKFTGE